MLRDEVQVPQQVAGVSEEEFQEMSGRDWENLEAELREMWEREIADKRRRGSIGVEVRSTSSGG